MAGKDFRHGPHHDAQKSRRTTLPLSVSGSLPSSLKESSAGSASPFFKAAGQICVMASMTTSSAIRVQLPLRRNILGEPPRLMACRIRRDATLHAAAVALDQFQPFARPEN